MILKASQRSGAKQLATHLLKTEENEHVEVHELRGFMADNLQGALKEIQAVSQGTRCKQFMFSLSLNPPQTENVPIKHFENALADIEKDGVPTDDKVADIFEAIKPLLPTPQTITFDLHLLIKSIASLKDLPINFLTFFNALISKSITSLPIFE